MSLAASTTAESKPSLNRVTGWLEKQADWTMSWRRRLFHLDDLTLSYRLDEHSPDKDCAQIECLERNAGHEHTFRIWTERGACWLLRAATSEEHRRWVDVISAALEAKDPIARNRRKEFAKPAKPNGDEGGAYPFASASSAAEGDDAAVILSDGAATRNKTASSSMKLLDGVLSAEVDKLSAWTKSWRRRYAMLDGINFYYSESPGGACKNRYVVRSVDRCTSQLELRVETSNQESFNIRFHGSEECSQWFAAIRQALRSQGLRWQAVACVAAQPAHLLLASPFQSSALVHGSRIVNTVADSSGTMELVEVSVLGHHPVSLLPVEPFQERPGVKLKPGRRSMTAVAFVKDSGKLYVYGGTPMMALPSAAERSLPICRDLWSVSLQQDSGSVPQWQRIFGHEESHALAGSAGHSMVVLSDGADGSRLVMIGGFRHDGLAVRTCQQFDPASGTVTDFPQLDTPRALHGTACFSDGSIVVIGGLAAASAVDKPLASASLYSPSRQLWMPLKMSLSLPGLVNPVVAVLGVEMFVFGGSGKAGSLPLLYSMVVVGDTLVVKPLECFGDTPVTHFGLSCAVEEESRTLYVIGATPSIPSAPHLHRVLLPSD